MKKAIKKSTRKAAKRPAKRQTSKVSRPTRSAGSAGKLGKPFADVVLEVGTEEIPARFWPEIISEVEEFLKARLAEEKLPYSSLKVLATTRRLAVLISDLKTCQDDQALELKGPPVKAAFDAEGKLTQAGLGFARSQGAAEKDLFQREVDGRPYLFAKVKRIGQPAGGVLAKVFPEILSRISLPLTMRWGEGEGPFIRPVHWILALIDRQVIPFTWMGIKTSRETCGHRFLSPSFAPIAKADQFEEALLRKKVIIDQDKRRAWIQEQAHLAAAEMGAEALLDPGLLEELSFISEYPSILMAGFSEEFLEIPPEIPIMVMKKYQRTIPLKKEGKLLPNFLITAEGLTNKNKANIKRGNEVVVHARLADGRFFYEEDKKAPLADWAKKLSGITWQHKLGTLAEKKDRIERLAVFIDSESTPDLPPLEKYPLEEKIRLAAALCKADIPTHLVGEYSGLEGVAGRLYALEQGLDPQVAQAIEEHLLPKYPGDRLPQTLLGTIIGLADRLDSLIGYLGQGITVSGSQDPYGIRRLSHGLIKILLETKQIEVDLDRLIEAGLANFKEQKISLQEENVRKTLLPLLYQRLKQELLDQGSRYDLVDAVLAVSPGDPKKAREIVTVLLELSAMPWFKGLVDAGVRVYRLSARHQSVEVREDMLLDPMEKELWNKYQTVKHKVEDWLAKKDHRQAISELSRLAETIDKFFVKVMVMAEDEAVKNNRLSLLKNLDKLFKQLADFNAIVQQ